MLPLLALLGSALAGGTAGFAGSRLMGSGQSNPQQNSNGSRSLGSSGNFFTGSGAQVHQLPRFSQGAMGDLDKARQMGLQGLQNSSPSFQPFAQQAQEQFSQKTVPGIAERFTQSGAQRSSAFGQQLGQAGADLSTNLASMGSQFDQQQQNHFAKLLGLGLTPQFDTKIEGAAPGFGQNLASSLAGGVGQSLPNIIQLLLKYLS